MYSCSVIVRNWPRCLACWLQIFGQQCAELKSTSAWLAHLHNSGGQTMRQAACNAWLLSHRQTGQTQSV